MRCSNKNGVSLVETLVVSVIFSFMIAGLYTTMLAGNISWQTYEANVLAQQQARQTVSYMTKDLRVAENIVLAQDSSSFSLSFNKPEVGNFTYTWATTGGNANRVLRQTPTATYIIAQNIKALSVTDLTDNITVNVTSNVPTQQGATLDDFQLIAKVAKR